MEPGRELRAAAELLQPHTYLRERLLRRVPRVLGVAQERAARAARPSVRAARAAPRAPAVAVLAPGDEDRIAQLLVDETAVASQLARDRAGFSHAASLDGVSDLSPEAVLPLLRGRLGQPYRFVESCAVHAAPARRRRPRRRCRRDRPPDGRTRPAWPHVGGRTGPLAPRVGPATPRAADAAVAGALAHRRRSGCPSTPRTGRDRRDAPAPERRRRGGPQARRSAARSEPRPRRARDRREREPDSGRAADRHREAVYVRYAIEAGREVERGAAPGGDPRASSSSATTRGRRATGGSARRCEFPAASVAIRRYAAGFVLSQNCVVFACFRIRRVALRPDDERQRRRLRDAEPQVAVRERRRCAAPFGRASAVAVRMNVAASSVTVSASV